MTDAYTATRTAGSDVIGWRKDNWAATAVPTATDDADSGFEVGSRWSWPADGREWVCFVATVGSAVWLETTAGSLVVDLTVTGAHGIDRDDGETHDLTLTGNATFTLAGATANKATDLRLILRQDATGSRTVTWPGTITWVGGSAPTLQTAANAVDTIGLLSTDDGVSWFGYHVSAGTTDHGALTGLSDDDHPQYVKDSEFTAEDDVLIGTGSGTFTARASGRHAHIAGEELTYDGSSTAYWLANLAEPLTVAAYDKDGDRVGITHDEAELDKITFDSAPAAGTGWVDYAAQLG